MSNSELIQFFNCRLVRNHSLINEDLWIRNGKIVNPESVFFDEQIRAKRRIDCKNSIIAAGYIDLQINGGFGVDFSHDIINVQQGINKVACGLVKYGVTSFCPTLVTSPGEIYKRIIPRVPKETDGAGVLGVHLEGPFISVLKKGAHSENFIQTINDGMKSLLSIYGPLDNVRIVTLAPEKDVTGEVTRALTASGITVSLGHSMGNLKDGERAVQNGATLITHLFNGMLPFHHRDPGLVGLLASDNIPSGQTVYYGIIADGVHTHPAALRIAHRTHPDGLILVTDAFSALGFKEGLHRVGQLTCEVKNGKAFVVGTDTLCGSIASMDQSVRIFKQSTDCSIVYAIEAATLHPAKCLKIEDKKGTLAFGSDADFIMLDDELNVLSTWINGECLYTT